MKTEKVPTFKNELTGEIERVKVCNSCIKTYSEKDLIEFGNYLLSSERKEKLNNDERVINSVNDTDLDYFFNK